MEASLHAAKLAGLSRIELMVHADSTRAVALYERVGFVHEGIKRQATGTDGRFGDAIMMAITEWETRNAETI